MLGKKRLIIFILTLLFSFNSFFYTPKAIENLDEKYSLEQYSPIEPREPITLTSGLILAIITLLSACGVAITTIPMAQDMAQRVYDKVKDIPGAITKVGDKIKFNLVKGVLDAVKSVVSELPDSTLSTQAPSVTISNGVIDGSSLVFKNVNFQKGFYSITTLSPVEYVYANFRLNGILQTLYPYGYSFQCTSGNYPAGTNFSFKVFTEESKIYLQWYINGVACKSSSFTKKYCYLNYGDIVSIIFKSDYDSSNNYPFGGSSDADSVINSTYDGLIDIPYTPDTTKDVDYETKPKAWFPSLDSPTFGGSISAPVNQPLPDISVDAPIVSPNDFVADNDISIDATDTTIPDGSVDSDTVLDRILSAVTGFFDGFWDALGSLFSGLLAPIISLLEFLYEGLKSILGFLGDILSAILSGVISAIGALGDLLQAILDFLLSLVVSLVDALVLALEELFIPTIDLSKAFELPDNIFLPFHEFGFDDLLNVTPKPIRFDTTVKFGSLTYPIKIHFDEIDIISDNITLIRNIFSYSLLLITINLVIATHLPRKVMD